MEVKEDTLDQVATALEEQGDSAAFERLEDQQRRMGAIRREVEAAGFRLATSADFLRHPEDPRDERIFQPKVPVDEFVLKFQKPN